MDDQSRELDLEIVSASWRSVADHNAYDQMLEAWSRKLEAAKRQPRIPLLDSVLRNQLGSIDQLLDDRRDLQIEDPLEIAISQTPAPAMVLSPDGLVATLNHGAADYFGVEQGLRAGTAWLREDSLTDYASVREAGLGQSNVDYAIVRLSNRNAFAEVYQLLVEGIDRSYTVVRSLELDWDPSVSVALMKAFGMTQAECQVCKLLFEHRDLSVVAEQRGVKLETVRNQVKSILSKVEVHSKAELVRFVALLCARAASQRQRTDLAWSDPLGREVIITRRDGRKLAYTWIGAEDGTPILYIPDHTSCSFFPEQMREELHRSGVKLCILSLPGMGNSDPALEKDQLDDGCLAIEEWCDAMGICTISAMGSRGSQYYLFCLASRKPELFRFLLCVGLPWNISRARTAGMPSADITLLKLSKDAPLAYDLVCRIGYRMIKKNGPDVYWQRLFSANLADVETARDTEALPLLRASVRHLVAQGYDAFKQAQIICATSPLDDWVKQTRVPLHWIVPGLSVELCPDELEEIRNLNSVSTLEVVDGSGELMAFQRPALFADRVIALAQDDPAELFGLNFGRPSETNGLQ